MTMSDVEAFQDLVCRLRHGQEAAAAELVRTYGPVLRGMIHVRMVSARLRRRYDVDDICQSVLASFFVRAALGQYQLDKPEDLVKLLAAMGRNKVVDKTRQPEMALPEDRRIPLGEVPAEALVSSGGTPSQHVAFVELLHEAQRRLSSDERRVLQMRQQGLEWTEIAEQLGGTAEALRKRFSRSVELVSEQLGLDYVS